MDQLDLIYRALAEYRKQTADDRDCSRLRGSIAAANAETDRIEVVKNLCAVEKDWIEAIEEGLVHIEKAIKEERQFIRSNGEVLPIEKVKRVSKDSVEHLAKHSDLITRKQEGKDIIPDKLYTVERLSDYAVYENRFLYMLLCYLRDFITLRYNKILELTNTYRGSIAMNKSIVANKRRITYELTMKEERQDDPYLKEHNHIKDTIDRIDLLLKAVMHFLSTPLMQEVGKVPMLKPPITKTNVLKMNQNFKGAVALYDFVTSYQKRGYTVEERSERIGPFPDDTADELAEVVSLTSFLTYQYGLGIQKYLQRSFEIEQQRRKSEEIERHAAQLKQLKRRVQDHGDSPEEYMLALEKRVKALENDSVQLEVMRQEIERLQTEANAASQKLQEFNGVIEMKQRDIDLLERKNADDISSLREEGALAFAAMRDEMQREVDGRDIKLTQMETTVQDAYAQCEQIRNDFDVEFSKKKQELETEFLQKSNDLEAFQREKEIEQESLRADMNRAYEKLLDEKALSDGRLMAIRREYHLIGEDEDYTTQESFGEIERQYKMFKAFFRQEWRKTKKRIWKDFFRWKRTDDTSHDEDVSSYRDAAQWNDSSQTGDKPHESAFMPEDMKVQHHDRGAAEDSAMTLDEQLDDTAPRRQGAALRDEETNDNKND